MIYNSLLYKDFKDFFKMDFKYYSHEPKIDILVSGTSASALNKQKQSKTQTKTPTLKKRKVKRTSAEKRTSNKKRIRRNSIIKKTGGKIKSIPKKSKIQKKLPKKI
jgi:hypothetical protein